MLFDLQQLELLTSATGFGLLSAFEDRHTVDADRNDRRVNDTLTAESIELPPPHAWTTGSDGQSLVSNRRLRRDGSNSVVNGSTLVEIDLLAKPAGNSGLEISQTIYVNGHRSDHVIWRVR